MWENTFRSNISAIIPQSTNINFVHQKRKRISFRKWALKVKKFCFSSFSSGTKMLPHKYHIYGLCQLPINLKQYLTTKYDLSWIYILCVLYTYGIGVHIFHITLNTLYGKYNIKKFCYGKENLLVVEIFHFYFGYCFKLTKSAIHK